MLTLAAVSLLMVGCASTSTTTDTSVDTSTSSMDSMTESSVSMTASSMSEAAVINYKDGTYTADGNYTSPAGQEEVGVTLTLANGVVTDASFEGKATNPGSKMMQGKFSEGYKAMVVGKSIDEISLGVVNGSSLAPKGFMDAVAKIKAEAKAS